MPQDMDRQMLQCIQTHGVLIQQQRCTAEPALMLYPSATQTRPFSVQGKQRRFDGEVHDRRLPMLMQEILALLAPQTEKPRPVPQRRSAIFSYERQETAGTRLIGPPKHLEGRFTDYGNGTLETPDGAAFRTVDGTWIKDGRALQPGSEFMYGPDDRYTARILAQQTPWQPT